MGDRRSAAARALCLFVRGGRCAREGPSRADCRRRRLWVPQFRSPGARNVTVATRRTIIVVLALIVAGKALAQRPAPMHEFPSRISAESRVTLEQLADSARLEGLPTEPLVAKAAEGVLKQAADTRIVQAVRALMRELRAARSALPPDSRRETIMAGASAVHVGVPPEALRRLWTNGGEKPDDGDLAVALVTLADLGAKRVGPERGAVPVRLVLGRQATDAEVSAFRAGVARDIGAGNAPDVASADRTRALVQQIDARARRGKNTERETPSPTNR